MALGLGGPSRAEPPQPPSAWQVTGSNALTWTAPERLPIAEAAVEFWSGDRLLGCAHSRDLRTFPLSPDGPFKLEDLQVRAAY